MANYNEFFLKNYDNLHILKGLFLCLLLKPEPQASVFEGFTAYFSRLFLLVSVSVFPEWPCVKDAG